MKHAMEEQQAIVARIMERLELVDPHCILAGGAPRDWYFGNPCNDLDFYLYSTASNQSVLKDQMSKLFGGVEWNTLGGGDKTLSEEDISNISDNYKMRVLRTVLEAEIDVMKVQLIFVMSDGDQFKVVEEINVSICRIYWKYGKIIPHIDFIFTVKSGIAFGNREWLSPICSKEEVPKHFWKMKDRFPQYRFYISRSDAMNVFMGEYVSGVLCQ